MNLLKKRPAAAVIMVLAILAGLALGGAKKPAEAGVAGDFLYLFHNEGGAVTQDTAEYMEAFETACKYEEIIANSVIFSCIESLEMSI